MIAAGVACTQQAGDGPYVYAKGRARPFSSRTARCGERLGLLRLDWCTVKWAWRWSLTEKGWAAIARREIPSSA